MEDITIADASVRLLDELYQIEKQCFKQEAFSKQQISWLLTDYNAVSFVAYVGRDLAGFIIARIDTEHNQLIGHILTIDIAPQYRRRGVAQGLMHKVEETIKQKGVKECRLEVREDNTAALNLYYKLGYKKVAKLKNYYPTAHGLYLKKALN